MDGRIPCPCRKGRGNPPPLQQSPPVPHIRWRTPSPCHKSCGPPSLATRWGNTPITRRTAIEVYLFLADIISECRCFLTHNRRKSATLFA